MDSLQASRIAGGNSAIGRRESDFYPTPPEVTVALLDFLCLPGSTVIWEPAAGEGDFVGNRDALQEAGVRGYTVEGGKGMIFRAEAQPIRAGAGSPVTRVLNFDIQPVGKCRHTPVVYAKDYDTPQGDHELWFAECKECGRHTFGHPSKENAVAAWDNGEVYDGWLITEVEK